MDNITQLSNNVSDQGDNMPLYDDDMIVGLFNNFLAEGGCPKVTAFKKHLDQLINAKVKPLCGRSSKAGLVDDWRSEVKARFSGRGAKWVKVSIEEIGSTLVSLGDEEDVRDYVSWISAAGFAWIRFSGPRVHGGENCAAFEVRTGGSTIDHPRQLHYVPVATLDDKISVLGGTPRTLKLEDVAKTEGPLLQYALCAINMNADPVMSDVSDDSNDNNDHESFFEESNDTVIGDFVVSSPVVVNDDDYEDAMGDIEALMALEDEEL